MKKRVVFLFAIILIMLLVISFAGCENNGGNQLPGDSNVTDDEQDIDDGQDPDDGQNPDDGQDPDDGQEPNEPEYTPTEGLSYILNGDGNGYTVTGKGTAMDTDIVIPSEYNGLPVTGIGNEAFIYCTSLTSIDIPDSVTCIGEAAFYSCTSLTSIDIPDSVTCIGGSVFYDCALLQYNEYNNAYYLGNENNPYFALIIAKDRYITSCDIHVNTKIIADRAFSSCPSLTSITVDGNNTSFASIDGNLYNKNITTFIQYAPGKTATEFTVPDSVTVIGDRAFYSCTSLTSVTIGNSVTSIGGSAFAFCGSLTSIVIPDSVTSIGYDAFYSCTSLTSIVIPDSVTSIGDSAFAWCDSLTSVTIGNGVTSIGDEAFYRCTSLTSITVDENNTAYASIDGNLYNKDKTTLIQYAIGKTATEFTIPDNVTSIGEDAFRSCDSLTSVTIGNSVTSIGDYAFEFCRSLTSIVIPDSVTGMSIGDYVFFLCTSLNTIYYNGDIESWLNKDWHSRIMSSGRTLYINNVKTEGELTIPDGVTTIPSRAFAYQNITSVIVPDSVTSIGDDAFVACTSLTSITVDENNTAYVSIDGNLYNKDKTTLIQYATGKTATEFTIPDSVTSIGDSAFESCDSLTSVTIGNGVTSIGDSAFESCDSLTSVTIGNGVTGIGDWAFGYCTSLTSVTIGNSVTSIGGCVFYDCYSLTDVYYGGTEEQWNGISIGNGNEDLTSATIHFSADTGS